MSSGTSTTRRPQSRPPGPTGHTRAEPRHTARGGRITSGVGNGSAAAFRQDAALCKDARGSRWAADAASFGLERVAGHGSGGPTRRSGGKRRIGGRVRGLPRGIREAEPAAGADYRAPGDAYTARGTPRRRARPGNHRRSPTGSGPPGPTATEVYSFRRNGLGRSVPPRAASGRRRRQHERRGPGRPGPLQSGHCVGRRSIARLLGAAALPASAPAATATAPATSPSTPGTAVLGCAGSAAVRVVRVVGIARIVGVVRVVRVVGGVVRLPMPCVGAANGGEAEHGGNADRAPQPEHGASRLPRAASGGQLLPLVPVLDVHAFLHPAFGHSGRQNRPRGSSSE